MPLPWVRLDTTFPSNPKLLALLGERDGHRAAFVWCCGLAYSGAHGTDGFIPYSAMPFIHCRKADATRLVEHRLWHDTDGGWLINGWVEFQETNEETQQRRERAQQASRAAQKANCIRWHGKECGCWQSFDGETIGYVPLGDPNGTPFRSPDRTPTGLRKPDRN